MSPCSEGSAVEALSYVAQRAAIDKLAEYVPQRWFVALL